MAYHVALNCELVSPPLSGRVDLRRRMRWWTAVIMWLVAQAAHAENMNLVVTLDRADVQRRVERLFPVVRADELVSVRLHHPRVILTAHSNRIGLGLRIDATAAEQFSVSGHVTVDGVLRFAGPSGDFYLDDADVKDLQVDGIPTPYLDQIRRLADGVLRDLLRDHPIYTLGQLGEAKRFMGSEIKSIKVRDGKMVVELSMP